MRGRFSTKLLCVFLSALFAFWGAPFTYAATDLQDETYFGLGDSRNSTDFALGDPAPALNQADETPADGSALNLSDLEQPLSSPFSSTTGSGTLPFSEDRQSSSLFVEGAALPTGLLLDTTSAPQTGGSLIRVLSDDPALFLEGNTDFSSTRRTNNLNIEGATQSYNLLSFNLHWENHVTGQTFVITDLVNGIYNASQQALQSAGADCGSNCPTADALILLPGVHEIFNQPTVENFDSRPAFSTDGWENFTGALLGEYQKEGILIDSAYQSPSQLNNDYLLNIIRDGVSSVTDTMSVFIPDTDGWGGKERTYRIADGRDTGPVTEILDNGERSTEIGTFTRETFSDGPQGDYEGYFYIEFDRDYEPIDGQGHLIRPWVIGLFDEAGEEAPAFVAENYDLHGNGFKAVKEVFYQGVYYPVDDNNLVHIGGNAYKIFDNPENDGLGLGGELDSLTSTLARLIQDVPDANFAEDLDSVLSHSQNSLSTAKMKENPDSDALYSISFDHSITQLLADNFETQHLEKAFEGVNEPGFFQRETSPTYLTGLTSIALENTLGLSESNPARRDVTAAWLGTLRNGAQSNMKAAYPLSHWQEYVEGSVLDHYESVGIIVGDNESQMNEIERQKNEDQVREIIGLLNLNNHQETIFRDYRILINDNQNALGNSDIEVIHDAISLYKPSLMYRLGRVSGNDYWLAPDKTLSMFSRYSPNYATIQTLPEINNRYPPLEQRIHHEIGHAVDLINLNGHRDQFLNQHRIREELFPTALGQGTIIETHKVLRDNQFVYYASTSDLENTAEEWGIGVMGKTDGRLTELVENGVESGELDSLQIFLTLGANLVPHEPDQSELPVHNILFQIDTRYNGDPKINGFINYVRDVLGKDPTQFLTEDDLSGYIRDVLKKEGVPQTLSVSYLKESIFPSQNITTDYQSIGSFSVEMDDHSRITRITTNAQSGDLDFPFRAVNFAYEPFDPLNPDKVRRIATMTVEYLNGTTRTIPNSLA